MNNFLHRLWWVTKSVFLYNNWRWPAQWLGREEAPKHFPKPNLHQEKVMFTVWWSAASLVHYSFLNPSENVTSEKYAQQIDEVRWKLQDLQPVSVNRMSPVLLMTLYNQYFKSWTNWAMKFCLTCHIHLTSQQPPLLQASQQLLQGKLFPNQQEAENAFQVFIKTWSTDFTLQQ